MSNYRKTMADALREMYPLDEETQLDEATMSSSQIARLKKAYEPMRDKKISPSNANKLSAMMDKVGKDKEALIQLFKADIPFVSQSAVTQLITKHDMKGAEINKLREEVDLDEVYQVYVKSPTAKSGWIAQGQPHKTEASAKKDAKNAGGVIKIVKEEVDLDESNDTIVGLTKGQAKNLLGTVRQFGIKGKLMDIKGKGISIKLSGKNAKEFVSDMKNLGLKTEEADLDEGTWATPDTPKEKAALKKLLSKPLKAKDASDKLYDLVGDDEMADDLDDYADKHPNEDVRAMVKSHMKRLGIKEDTDLDEEVSVKDFDALKKGDTVTVEYKSAMSSGKATFKVTAKNVVGKARVEKVTLKSTKNPAGVKHFLYKRNNKVSFAQGDMGASVVSFKKEEVDLDEGKMSQLHQYIKDKKSPEEIAKLMKLDVKTIKALMSSHHPEDVDESAASDARRAISKDKDLRRGKDSADDDDFASADDVKGASKNIIMQLRKAGNRASMGVEFGDGKKVQIPPKMAIAVQQKYNAMKKPADKEKFQARIAKSYKDMLSALKEELQPKKESILERMNRKIKENKHG